MHQSQLIVRASEHVPSANNDEVSLLSGSLSLPHEENDRTFVLETPVRVNLHEIELQSESFFMGQVSQVNKLLEDINSASCLRPNCKGSLKLVAMEQQGLGGAAKMSIACSECKSATLIFKLLLMMSGVRV